MVPKATKGGTTPKKVNGRKRHAVALLVSGHCGGTAMLPGTCSPRHRAGQQATSGWAAHDPPDVAADHGQSGPSLGGALPRLPLTSD